MCAYSMIMDHYRERWEPLRWVAPVTNPWPNTTITIRPQTAVTQEEVDEFRRLLERAREYDKKHNQPDCELDEKRQALKKVADELGIDISFV